MAAKKKGTETVKKIAASDGGPKLTRFQKFEVVRVRRSTITNAPYNPRTIDAFTKKRMKEVLKKKGLLEAVVVNKRSGNLVGGHQRLGALDGLEGGNDYLLDVCLVDLSDKDEREANLLLNNMQIQGDWDLAKLADMLPQIDIEAAGFQPVELETLFDGAGITLPNLFATENAPAAVQKATQDLLDAHPSTSSEEELEEEGDDDDEPDLEVQAGDDYAARTDKIKREKAILAETAKGDAQDTDYTLTVVFKNSQDRDKFVEQIGAPPGARFVDAARVWHAVKRSPAAAPATTDATTTS